MTSPSWSRIAKVFFVGLLVAMSLAKAPTVSAAPGYYNVTFNPNGGPNTPASITNVLSGHSPISSTCLRPGLRTGYTLIGWRSDYSGTSTVYGAPCADPTFYNLAGTTMPEFNVVFTAEWQGNTLNITYDSQGGSSVSDGAATTRSGDPLNPLPTPPTRNGFLFLGWNTNANGTGVDLGATIAPGFDGPTHYQTSDFTAYAQWMPITLNITYDSQGGSSVSDGDTTTLSGGSVSTLPTDPTRNGYTFAGWYTASSGGSLVSTSSSHGQTSDFTLYAQWTANPPPVVSPSPTVVTVPAASTPAVPSSPTIELGNPPALGGSDVTRSDGVDVSGVIRTAIVGNVSTITIRNSDGTEITVSHAPTLMKTNYTVYRGTSLTISGRGYQPSTDLDVWLNSNLTYLGSTKTINDGSFSFVVVVPLDFELGNHTLQVEGTVPIGVDQATFLGLRVLDPSNDLSQFPLTGTSNDVVIWSLLLIAIGALIMVRVAKMTSS